MKAEIRTRSYGIKDGIFLMVCFGLLPFGCKHADITGLIGEADKKSAERILGFFQSNQIDSMYDLLDPGLKTDQTREILGKLIVLRPSDSLLGRKYLKVMRITHKDTLRTQLVIQDAYRHHSVIYELGFSRAGTSFRLENFRLHVFSPGDRISLRVLWESLNPIRTVFCLGLVAVPAFILVNLVLLAFTKRVKRKWLWFIFVSLGFAEFKLDWFSGAMTTNLTAFQILGSGYFTQSEYGPLWVSFSVPVGAILFLLKRKKLAGSSGKDREDAPAAG